LRLERLLVEYPSILAELPNTLDNLDPAGVEPDILDAFSSLSDASVLEHHGKSLRGLWLGIFGFLEPLVFDAGLVDEIRGHCPILEVLKLPIPRSKGDRRELAIYRTLGAIPRLQKLSLTLDSSDRTVLKVTEDCEVTGDYDVEISIDPSTSFINNFSLLAYTRWREINLGMVTSAMLSSTVPSTKL